VADDPRWPRAAAWLDGGDGTAAAADNDGRDVGRDVGRDEGRDEDGDEDGGGRGPGRAAGRARLAVLGVPASARSLSPSQAHTTPAAVRTALQRYSTWAWSSGTDLADVPVADLGDVLDPDGPGGDARIEAAARRAAERADLVVALGGDNSITCPLARGFDATGLVTLDAHHDLRDGDSNGSPVRRLVESGLDGHRIVQIGIADYANAPGDAARARRLGITVVPRAALRTQDLAAVVRRAIDAAAGGDPDARVYVDLDVDVCDRSVAPACPASAPGGLTADELRVAARTAGGDARVVGIDLVEVDAAADAADGRTVRLVALCLLEAAGAAGGRVVRGRR
jgi:formiminoglutamase